MANEYQKMVIEYQNQNGFEGKADCCSRFLFQLFNRFRRVRRHHPAQLDMEQAAARD